MYTIYNQSITTHQPDTNIYTSFDKTGYLASKLPGFAVFVITLLKSPQNKVCSI